MLHFKPIRNKDNTHSSTTWCFDLFMEFQRQYYEACYQKPHFGLELIKQRSVSLIDGTKDPLFYVFFCQIEEHINTIIGDINKFNEQISRVHALSSVYNDFEDSFKFIAYYELLYPVPEFALSIPYTIKQRFIFSASKLLIDTFNIEKNTQPPIGEINDRRINIHWLKNYSNHYRSLPAFLYEIEQLDAEEYQTRTSSFRNFLQHRMPVRVEHGHSNFITREGSQETHRENIFSFNLIGPDGASHSYSYGAIKPLMLEEIIPLLISQHKQACSAFEAFEIFLKELLDAWRCKRNESLIYLVNE